MMNKREKSKHNKRIITITIIIICVSIISLAIGRKPSYVESVFRDTVSNIEYYLIKTPIKYVGNIFNEFNELKDVYDENEKLKEQLDTYTRLSAMNDTLNNELESLKKLMSIDYLPTDYKVKYTSIINRDAENWDTEVTIDLGKRDGVKVGMSVVSSDGMIGVITQVNTISSTVSLLCNESPSYQLPIMILNGTENAYGLLTGYDIKKNCYTVSLLSDVDKIEKGATVVTSGLGGKGKSPKGILIGKFESKMSDSTSSASMNQYYIKPCTNFSKLEYVAVVQRVNKK